MPSGAKKILGLGEEVPRLPVLLPHAQLAMRLGLHNT